MATYEFNNQVKFILPPGFVANREVNDDGEEALKIQTGAYVDDDGEIEYEFTCFVAIDEFNPADAADDITSENLVSKVAERLAGPDKYLELPGKPEIVVVSKRVPEISFFGQTIKMFVCMCLIRVSDWSVLRVLTTNSLHEEDPEEDAYVYENIYELLKATRINGKALPTEGFSPYTLRKALERDSDTSNDYIDADTGYQVKVATGFDVTSEETVTDLFKKDAQNKGKQESMGKKRALPKYYTVDKDFCEIEDGELKSYNADLEQFWLPSGITKIGEDVFSYKDITGVIIPYGVKEISENAFSACSKLEFVYIPETVEVIESTAFDFATSLSEVVIPNGVKRIGSMCFYKCEQLIDIYVPESVEEIEGVCAFDTENKATKIHVVPGSYAEKYCQDYNIAYDYAPAPEYDVSAASGIELPKNIADFRIEAGVLTKYLGDDEHLIIPSGVKTIQEHAVTVKENLRHVTIPEGVQAIEDYAFYACKALKTVDLPKSLISLSGFKQCEGLETIVIPDGVQIIAKDAFLFCSNLKTVVIGRQVHTIEESAFGDCNKLRDVYIPASVTNIDDGAFWWPFKNIRFHIEGEGAAKNYAEEHDISYDYNVTKYTELLDDPATRDKAPQGNQSQSQDYIQEIKRLKELLDIGAITSDEFEAKKKQLLAL